MKRALSLTSILMVFSATAAAQPQANDNPESSGTTEARSTFDALDQDGDGTIVADEVGASQKRAFQQLLRVSDQNQDGNLSLAEFLGGLKAKDQQPAPTSVTQRSGGRGTSRRPFAQQLLRKYDRNKDGRLTKDELPEDANPTLRNLFDRLKTDAITMQDLSRSRSRATGSDRGQLLKQFDKNGDGKLAPDEVPDRAKPLVAGILRRAGKSPQDSLTLDDLNSMDQPGQRNGQRSRSRKTEANRSSRSRDTAPRPTDGDRPADGERRTDGERSDRRGATGTSSSGLPALLRTLDTNGDGQWDRDEFARLAQLFDQLDRDRDGLVNPRELFGARSSSSSRDSSSSRERGDRPQAAQSRSRKSQPTDRARTSNTSRQRPAAGVPYLLRRFDRDGDGKLSANEVQGRLKDHFDTVDANGDGFITAPELQKASSNKASSNRSPQRGPRAGNGAAADRPEAESDRPRFDRRRPQ